MLAALVFVLGMPWTSCAIVVDATLGHGGFYLPGKWTPISVTVENLPRADKVKQDLVPFSGFCELASEANGGNPAPVLFSRPLDVPVNDRKKIILYAKFSPSDGKAQVSLVSKAGKSVADVMLNRKPVENGSPLVVVVHSADVSITFPKIDGLPAPQVAYVEPGDLPDKWYGYDGIKLLVIPRIKEQMLDAPRASALHKWVAQGGDLLLIGGRYSQTYRKSVFEEMLPVDIINTAAYRMTAAGFEPYVEGSQSESSNIQLDEVKPREGASLVFQALGKPLLYERNFQSGKVLYLCTDWISESMKKLHLNTLVHTTLVSKSDFSGAMSQFDSQFLSMDNNAQEHFGLGSANLLPNSGLVGLLLLSYLLLVGPINFFILAKKKRLELAWFTVPAIVVIYSAAIYALSSHVKGNDSVMRQFNFISGRANSDTARMNSLAMFFLPKFGTHKIETDAVEAAESPHTFWTEQSYFPQFGNNQGAAQIGTRVVESQRQMLLPEVNIPQWAPNFIRLEDVVDLGGKINVSASYDGSSLSGNVTNGTAFPLILPRIYFSGLLWKIAKNADAQLAAGESADFKIQIEGSKEGESPLKNQLEPASVNTKKSDYMSEVVDTATRSKFQWCLFELGQKISANPCILIARIPNSYMKVKIDQPLTKSSYYTFLALSCDVSLSNLPVRMSFDDLSRRIVLAETTPYSAGQVSLKDGNATFAYSIPCMSDFAVAFSGEFACNPETVKRGLGLNVFDFDSYQWNPVQFRITSAGANSSKGQFTMGEGSYIHPQTHSMLLRISDTHQSKIRFNSAAGNEISAPVISSLNLTETPKEPK
jgi:hypothetical protein